MQLGSLTIHIQLFCWTLFLLAAMGLAQDSSNLQVVPVASEVYRENSHGANNTMDRQGRS